MKSGWRGWVIPLAMLVAAEIAMRVNDIQSDALARPTTIAVALGEALFDRTILRGTVQTLGAAFGGIAIGGGLGLAAGLWLGLSAASAKLAGLSVELFRPIPSVALIPIAMLIYGFGYRMEISIVAFTCFWPMLLLSQSAVANVERRLVELARLLRLSPLQQIFKIFLPAALPGIFVAFRLTAGIALTVAVTVEIAANPRGLGYGMIIAQQDLQPELMYALLLWIGIIGWGLNYLLLMSQRHFFGRGARPA